MIQFIIATFAILAAAFWILSGGSDFVPETRPEPVEIAQSAPEPAAPEAPAEVPAPAPEEAAAAPEPSPETPAQAGQSEQTGQTASAASFSAPIISSAPSDTPEPAPPPAEPEVQPQPEPEAEAAPASRYGGEVRRVDADRVNLRSGPSTDYRVLDTLIRDTRVEILAIDELGAEPWAELLVLDTRLEGFMALRFLKPE